MKEDDSEFERETFIQKNGPMIFFSLVGVILISIPYMVLINRALPYSKNLHITFETNDVIKPFSDRRTYKYIQLSNFLDTLLIHDPDAATGGASLSVGVGSAAEPKELPGIAHLLEHMMFLGSKKYPKNSEFDDFISQNGGATNAFTGDTSTTYFFAVNDHSLEKGLDMFSNAFINPSLSGEMIDNELNAVNSEYEMDLTREGWRFHELLRRLSNSDHSFSRFSIGNQKTLKESPKSAKYNLTDEVVKFFNENYSSHKMSLVIVSSHSMEKLEKWASEKFSQIKYKQNSIKTPNSNKNIEAFPSEKLKKIVFYKPIGHDQTLSIVFPINSKLHKDYLAKSVDFVTDSLSSTSKGSLYRTLKQKGYINDLNVHYAQKYPEFGLLTISSYLTEEGMENYKEVMNIIYAGINLIKEKGITEERYKTLSILSYLNFMFQPKKPIQDSLIDFVMKVSSMPIHHLLVGWEVYMNYQPELISNVTAQMIPNNSIVLIGSDHFNVKTTHRMKEKKFKNTKSTLPPYILEELTVMKMNLWSEDEIFQNGFEPISNVIHEISDGLGAWAGSFQRNLKMNFEDGNEDFIGDADYLLSLNRTAKGIWHDMQKKGAQFIKSIEKKPHLKDALLGNVELQAEGVKEAWDLTHDSQKLFKNKNFRFFSKASELFKINSTSDSNVVLEKPKDLEKPSYLFKLNLDHNSLDQKFKGQHRFNAKKLKSSSTKFTLMKNLTEFDDMMKIPYLIEPISDDMAREQENSTNKNLILTNFSRFIPDSLAIESDCRRAINLTKEKDIFHSNQITKSDFSKLINDLIESKWDNLKESQAHELDKICLNNEIKIDLEALAPNVILNNTNTTIWLYSDRSDMTPLLYSRFKLVSQDPLKSDTEILSKKFLNLILRQKLMEDLEDARASGYRVNFLLQEDSIQVKLTGWTDKFDQVMKEIFESIKTINVTNNEFNQLKRSVQRKIKSDIKSMALTQAKLHLQKAMISDYMLPEDFLEPLEKITYEDIINVHQKLFKISDSKILFLGNSLSTTAKSISSNFLKSVNFSTSKDASKVSLKKKDLVKLSTEYSLVYKIINQNSEDLNNAIVNYYQLGALTPLDDILFKVITSSISKSAYGYLRTKYQLGYIVIAESAKVGGIEGLAIGVQGSSKDPLEMNAIIEKFLEFYREYLDSKSEDIYIMLRSKILQNLYNKPSKLEQKLDDLWKEMEMGESSTDLIDKYLPVVGLISKKRILSFYDKYFKRDKAKLSIQVFSSKAYTILTDEVLQTSRTYGNKPEQILYSLGQLKEYERYENSDK